MKVLMVCSEFAPLAKTGGLADAVTGLSAALAEHGHDVRVLLPRYSRLPPPTSPPLRSPGGDHTFVEIGAGGAVPRHGPAPPAPRVYAVDLGVLGSDGIYHGDVRDA